MSDKRQSAASEIRGTAEGSWPVGLANLAGGLFTVLLANGRTIQLDLAPLRDLPVLASIAGDPAFFDRVHLANGALEWGGDLRVAWSVAAAAAGPAPPRGFSVDTHLFRELGELLVGRDSTAVVELIKNAYDADASRVSVEGIDLRSGGALLRVVDDGNGMTRDRFEKAFLRVASRSKEGVLRRSPRWGRRYTGEKGIGRLAAHKLASIFRDSVVDLDPRGSVVAEVDAGMRV